MLNMDYLSYKREITITSPYPRPVFNLVQLDILFDFVELGKEVISSEEYGDCILKAGWGGHGGAPLIPGERQRQTELSEFESKWSIVRPCLKTNQNNNRRRVGRPVFY